MRGFATRRCAVLPPGDARFCHRRCAVLPPATRGFATGHARFAAGDARFAIAVADPSVIFLPKSAARRLGCSDAVTTGTGGTLIEARHHNFQRRITFVRSVRSCRQVLTRDFRRVRLWFRHVYFQSARGCPGGRIGGFVERLWWLGQRVLGRRHVGFDAGVNFRLDVGIGLGFNININIDIDCRHQRQLGHQPTKRRDYQHAERWRAEHAGDLTSDHAAHDARREERKAWHRL